jgi:hypothetical protein
MKLIETTGTPREIGLATGEALRDEIREMLDIFDERGRPADFAERLPNFVATARRTTPLVLEEMDATAAGANLPPEDIYRLNFPLYPDGVSLSEGCTNIVFAHGPDGPVWGKNNDGGVTQRHLPPVARLIRRTGSLPLLTFTFCGMVATLDGMNAEGLALGHSSVGTIFQQSDYHAQIRLWGYEGMLACVTTAEFVRHMASLPTRDKGYSIVVVDRGGVTCSIEAPVPLVQVRRSRHPDGHLHCVNCYQLPHLAEADWRTPVGKANAQARWEYLDRFLAGNDDFSLEGMKGLLRRHDYPEICRHASEDGCITEYSMIGLPQRGEVHYRHGLACEGEFEVVRL